MPHIFINGITIPALKGANLRNVLLKNGLTPHNGNSAVFNCHGLGTCGTCAVQVTGRVSKMTAIEKLRLGFPPHKPENNLRLACQCKILGNVTIVKHDGFWGQTLISPDTTMHP
ncbi:(2Fe-2S)-binding protein [Sphingobacteriales bacterium UPWRP_1]|nr:(2Fe-2S)-binding protein [Sphingobacteriales bacterium UPWRP_1]